MLGAVLERTAMADVLGLAMSVQAAANWEESEGFFVAKNLLIIGANLGITYHSAEWWQIM